MTIVQNEVFFQLYDLSNDIPVSSGARDAWKLQQVEKNDYEDLISEKYFDFKKAKVEFEESMLI